MIIANNQNVFITGPALLQFEEIESDEIFQLFLVQQSNKRSKCVSSSYCVVAVGERGEEELHISRKRSPVRFLARSVYFGLVSMILGETSMCDDAQAKLQKTFFIRVQN